MDREKVIKGMEQFRSDFKPFCGGKADWERFDAGLALLKEQENKKLIDADKLREKLGFAEHCEDCKHDSWKCGRDTFYSLYDFCTAIDIAIEELMREGR